MMLVNKDKVTKGGFGRLTKNSDEFLVLHRRVSALKSKRNFKIGITSAPIGRARVYDSRDSGRYHEMVVLYESGSDRRVRKLEAMLICKHPDSDNEWGGGGGPLGKPPYYLYIVRFLTGKERWTKRMKMIRKSKRATNRMKRR